MNIWEMLLRERDSRLTKREWTLKCPTEYSAEIEKWLTPLHGDVATEVCWEEGAARKVFDNGNGTYSVGVTDSEILGGGERREPVSVEDVQLFGLDWEQIVELVGANLALNSSGKKQISENFWHLGYFESYGKQCAYYFCNAHTDSEVQLESVRFHAQNSYVLYPRNVPCVLKVLKELTLKLLILADTPEVHLIRQPIPLTIDWNGNPFVVERPVRCYPFYEHDAGWDECWGSEDPPPSKILEDLCAIVLAGRDVTLSVIAMQDHPWAVHPLGIASAPVGEQDAAMQKGHIRFQTGKTQEVQVIWFAFPISNTRNAGGNCTNQG